MNKNLAKEKWRAISYRFIHIKVLIKTESVNLQAEIFETLSKMALFNFTSF